VIESNVNREKLGALFWNDLGAGLSWLKLCRLIVLCFTYSVFTVCTLVVVHAEYCNYDKGKFLLVSWLVVILNYLTTLLVAEVTAAMRLAVPDTSWWESCKGKL